jgi:plasmid stabilization system protein ParE
VRVIWSPLALDRAEAIARYIAEARPEAAAAWIDRLFARVTQLREFPESGRVVPELGRPEVRELPYPPYRIIYRLDPRRVVVLTVRHGRRQLEPGDDTS